MNLIKVLRADQHICNKPLTTSDAVWSDMKHDIDLNLNIPRTSSWTIYGSIKL